MTRIPRFRAWLSEFSKPVLLTFVAAVGAAVLLATLITVSGHNADLHTIATLEQQIRTGQIQRAQDVQQTASGVKIVEQFGAEIELRQDLIAQVLEGKATDPQILAALNQISAIDTRICTAIHCSAPSP